MRYTNAVLFMEEDGFIKGSFVVEDGVIRAVEIDNPERVPSGTSDIQSGDGNIRSGEADTQSSVIDLGGKLVMPGLVDIHLHGAAGADFSDGDQAGLETMARYLASNGITSFVPTSMTLPYKQLARAFQTAMVLKNALPDDCAELVGINMEGPYFSEKKRGAQNAAHLQNPDVDAFLKLYKDCGGLIRIVSIAPELPRAIAFTESVSKKCRVAIGHTNAGYEQTIEIMRAGASHLTHLYNAMPGFHHRNPGVIGAASENEQVTAELICDGIHSHPSAVRAAFKLFPGRICLISDSLRCCGLKNGTYELGGQTVFLADGVARLADGTIAGSAVNLFTCMQNAVKFGIPVQEAVAAASIRPARVVGCDREAGSLEAGKKADFLVCSRDLELEQVFVRGKRVR